MKGEECVQSEGGQYELITLRDKFRFENHGLDGIVGFRIQCQLEEWSGRLLIIIIESDNRRWTQNLSLGHKSDHGIRSLGGSWIEDVFLAKESAVSLSEDVYIKYR